MTRKSARRCVLGPNLPETTIDYRFRKFNKGFDFWLRRASLNMQLRRQSRPSCCNINQTGCNKMPVHITFF
jgi:hypothetical protein